ncbi:unnamed protein product [Triticum aestivum]|uniref:Uncharacterized protein n=2 Tax=Triticum aestivum TaxID=4565 RepID=A0A9R1JH25_WHEAT|nr:zuotin-like [Triticum aestivum]KAF7017230.1 hypothetical protein CFC21_030699 [Triticum aestivum]SPT18983.1 unnamed protein product [Triticum aestivum]
MAGLKPSVNLFALLDRNDPGDKLVPDFDDADAKQEVTAAKHKKKPTPAADHTKDLLGQAYPSARDYMIRKNQRERQAKAKAKAEAEARAKAKAKAKANNGVSGDDKSAGASADSSKVQDAAKQGRYYNNNYYNGASRNQQFGMSVRFGAPRRQQASMSMNEAAPAEGVEAPPAPQQAPPPPPPSLDDTNEFPSLK